MNNIADDLVYALVCQVAGVGEEFNSKQLKAIMVISYKDLQQELRRLQAAGMVRFTERICMWQRLR